jgi:hypothetical protein
MPPDSPNLLRALLDLQRSQDAHRQRAAPAALDPQLAALRAFQSARLRRTYADFLEDRRYRQACEFFLSDIYGVKDFSQRDQDFHRLYELLSRYLPASMLRALKDSLDLNHLSHALDMQLREALVGRLGMREQITAQMYSRAYRICDNYEDRKRQIARLVALVLEVGGAARLPLVGVTLRLARFPAERAGWHELYDFLQRGYDAFQPMKSVRRFALAIQDREMVILDNLMGGNPNPFDII